MNVTSPILLWQIYDRIRPSRLRLPLGVRAYGQVVAIYALCFFVGLTIPVMALVGLGLAAYILYETYRIVVDEYSIVNPPSQWLVAVQACCCHPCVISQLSRHVGRANGFIEYVASEPRPQLSESVPAEHVSSEEAV